MTSTEMIVFVTLRQSLRDRFFTAELVDQLEDIATVRWYDGNHNLDRETLIEQIDDVHVLVTGWGSPTVDETVLDHAPHLELILHTGGSVANYTTDAMYEKGITVCSANRPMARFVAECTLGHMIAGQRDFVRVHEAIRGGGYERYSPNRSLIGASIGLVGLGTIGRYLLPLLAPFDVSVQVYDPYVPPAQLTEYSFVEKATLEDTLENDIVSVHAARTPETRGMIGEAELAMIPDGALLVNTARAHIIEEQPLIDTLQSGRIRGALDVYHEEPLPEESPLRNIDTVHLTPHIAGGGPRDVLTSALINDLERYAVGEALQHEIPQSQAVKMTQ